jgi:hypothetical protein
MIYGPLYFYVQVVESTQSKNERYSVAMA